MSRLDEVLFTELRAGATMTIRPARHEGRGYILISRERFGARTDVALCAEQVDMIVDAIRESARIASTPPTPREDAERAASLLGLKARRR